MFQMVGVFAEFERSMIVERVNAGLAVAKAKGVKLGRPKVKERLKEQIRELVAEGKSVRMVSKKLKVSTGTVVNVKKGMTSFENLTVVPLNSDESTDFDASKLSTDEFKAYAESRLAEE